MKKIRKVYLRRRAKKKETPSFFPPRSGPSSSSLTYFDESSSYTTEEMKRIVSLLEESAQHYYTRDTSGRSVVWNHLFTWDDRALQSMDTSPHVTESAFVDFIDTTPHYYRDVGQTPYQKSMSLSSAYNGRSVLAYTYLEGEERHPFV